MNWIDRLSIFLVLVVAYLFMCRDNISPSQSLPAFVFKIFFFLFADYICYRCGCCWISLFTLGVPTFPLFIIFQSRQNYISLCDERWKYLYRIQSCRQVHNNNNRNSDHKQKQFPLPVEWWDVIIIIGANAMAPHIFGMVFFFSAMVDGRKWRENWSTTNEIVTKRERDFDSIYITAYSRCWLL